MNAEFEKLAREAINSNQTFEQYLLQLCELEVAACRSNALTNLIKQAQFPVEMGLENYDFSAIQSISKQQVWELARCEWVRQFSNVCLLGQPGSGKTHLAIALGFATCHSVVLERNYCSKSSQIVMNAEVC